MLQYEIIKEKTNLLESIMPIVSIYLVNHNYGHFLEQSIQSVLSQSFQDFELLIIDDGSTDNSREIIEKYSSNKKVKVIYQKNKGLNVTNNIAIRASRGQFIMRLDADDWLQTHALKKLVNTLENESNVGMVFPDYFTVDEDGKILNWIQRHNFNEVRLLDQPAHGACTLIRKKCLVEMGGYDEAFRCQDGYDLWIRFIQRFEVRNINEPLFFYRQHGNSLTKNEVLIHDTRAKILKKSADSKKNDFSSLVVIPTRGGACDVLSQPLRKLGGKALIDWSIQCALRSARVRGVIVTTPDDAVIEHVESSYSGKVFCVRRDLNKALPNSYLDETIRDAIQQYMTGKNIEVQAITILFIESPFRSNKHIDMAVDLLNLFETDQVVGVHAEYGNLYSHDGSGLKPINQQNVLRLEADEIYREVGNLKVLAWNFLFGEDKNIPTIGHVILDDMASVTITKEWEWSVGEYIANNFFEVEGSK